MQADSTLEEAHINTQAETRVITFVTGSWLVAAAILNWPMDSFLKQSSGASAMLQMNYIPTSGTE
jgi:hypothetical protein